MSNDNPVDPLLSKPTRRLYYPKFKFHLGFATGRQFIGYVAVSTRLTIQATNDSHEFPLGTTETRTSALGNVVSIVFHREFEVPYQVGVDDNQQLIFEIYDGDHMMTTEGYLLSTLTIPVVQLARPYFVLPVYRGTDLFGQIEVKTTFDIDCQNASIDCDIKAMAKTKGSFSSIPELDTPEYYEKVVMGYFPYRAPTVDDIRAANSSIPAQESESIEFGIHATKICPIDKQVMKRQDSSVFIKLCDLGVPPIQPDVVTVNARASGGGDDPENEEEALLALTTEEKQDLQRREEENMRKYRQKVREWANQQGCKLKLKEIWRSLLVNLKPYDILVDKLTLSDREFPIGPDSESWLAFQVYVTNWDEFNPTVAPKLLSYFVVSAQEFTAYSGIRRDDKTVRKEDKKKGESESVTLKEYKPEASQCHFRFRRPPIKKGDPIFSPIIKSERAEAQRKKDKWNISGKLKGLFSKKEEDEDEIDVIRSQEKNLFKERDPDDDVDEVNDLAEDEIEAGTLKLLNAYCVTTRADVADGDSRYDKLIEERHARDKRQWTSANIAYFNQHSTYQAHRLFLACAVLNNMLRGCTISPSVVADMTFPCTQHLLAQCHPDVLSSLAKSEKGQHESSATDDDGEAARDAANLTKNFVEPSFDSSSVLSVLNVCYNSIALLTQAHSLRALAGGGVTVYDNHFQVEVSKEEGQIQLSHWTKDVQRLVGFPLCDEIGLADEWDKIHSKGSEKSRLVRFIKERDLPNDYAQTAVYTSFSEILQGAMEAAFFYKPLLSKDELEADTGTGKEEIKQRYLFAVHKPSVCGTEFWARVPNDLEAKRVHNADIDAIIRLLCDHHHSHHAAASPHSPASPPHHGHQGRHHHHRHHAMHMTPVVWIMGRAPNSTNLKFKHKLHQLLEIVAPRDMVFGGNGGTTPSSKTIASTTSNHHKKGGKGAGGEEVHAHHHHAKESTSCLLIILSAENQFYYDETSPRVLGVVADPFHSFWQHWYEYFKDHPYVEKMLQKEYPTMSRSQLRAFGPHYTRLRLPRVRIYHHATWSEVIATSFLTEDTDAREAEHAQAEQAGAGAGAGLAADAPAVAAVMQQPLHAAIKSRPLIKQVFRALEEKFNRSDHIYSAGDLRWQYRNQPAFRALLNGGDDNVVIANNTPKTPKSKKGDSREIPAAPVDVARLDEKFNLRLTYEGNTELRRRFDIQNNQLIRTVIMEFLSDSFNQRQSLIEAAPGGHHEEEVDAATAGTESGGCVIA